MERQRVSSSNIASIGYDESSHTLEVGFLDGSVYQYFSVSKSTYDAFMYASSHGKYLARQIKGHYRYREV